MKMPLVGVVTGSKSDLPIVEATTKLLERLKIPYELVVSSAHRSPQKTMRYASSAARRGLKVIIAAAGGAAHLGGVIAAHTILPVIGVPINSSPLQGLDSLLATAQMPSGVPVATMAVGVAGAKNAAIFAAQILALEDPKVRARLKRYRASLSSQYK